MVANHYHRGIIFIPTRRIITMRQRASAIAPLIENITNDPPPTSQPTDNNPLTDLQDRQRAPQKQLSRCLEDRTRIDLSLSEISDEDVNGQMESNRSLENISSPR